ncbi:MAG: 2-hydroxyglutaryl-CoA dehydratase [Chloroflexota bacterium]|nr:2-hydroxyglutaryl-CoA dehydratase [Chloroflexota bacterium]
MLVAGVDIGSRTTKAILLNEKRELIARARVRTRPDFEALAEEALAEALKQVGAQRGDVSYLATTGFGRYNVPTRDLQVTEISAAGRGAVFLFPGTRSVIDVGAQNTRAIHVDADGRVKQFRSNDKCAAGAGSFIERAARYLEITVDQVGSLSMAGDKPVTISSICAVLAESEIINHVTDGHSVENILRGVHNSLSGRALGLLKKAGMEPEFTLVGGACKQEGMLAALDETLKTPVNASEDSDLACAIGAAVLGFVRLRKLGLLPAEAEPAAVAS